LWNNRRWIHDIMADLEKFIESTEEEIETMLREPPAAGERSFSKPVVYGFSIRLGPEGGPILRSFGDRPRKGFREPINEQMVDEQRQQLKIIQEAPGVEKEDFDIKSTEAETRILAARGEHRYQTTVRHQAPVDPATARAAYVNGILEIVFKLRDKTNKEYEDIRVE